MALLLWACSGLAQALPDAVRRAEADWRQWGSGEMSWLGFPLYRATLWVAGERPTAGQRMPPRRCSSTTGATSRASAWCRPASTKCAGSAPAKRSCSAGSPSCGASSPTSRRATASSACTTRDAARAFFIAAGRPAKWRCRVRAPVLRHLARPAQPQPGLRAALLKRPENLNGHAAAAAAPAVARLRRARPAAGDGGAAGLCACAAPVRRISRHEPEPARRLLLAARLLDAGIDPLLGGWSDRTASAGA
jgi:hypothetical protein